MHFTVTLLTRISSPNPNIKELNVPIKWLGLLNHAGTLSTNEEVVRKVLVKFPGTGIFDMNNWNIRFSFTDSAGVGYSQSPSVPRFISIRAQ